MVWAIVCQAWPHKNPHCLHLCFGCLGAHFQGLPNRPLPAKATATLAPRQQKPICPWSLTQERQDKGAARTAESPRLLAQPTSQLPHAPALQQSTCQAALAPLAQCSTILHRWPQEG